MGQLLHERQGTVVYGTNSHIFCLYVWLSVLFPMLN